MSAKRNVIDFLGVGDASSASDSAHEDENLQNTTTVEQQHERCETKRRGNNGHVIDFLGIGDASSGGDLPAIEGENLHLESDGVVPTPTVVEGLRSETQRRVRGRILRSDGSPNPEQTNGETAMDVVRRLRREKYNERRSRVGITDEDGSLLSLHEILSHVPDISAMTPNDLADFLCSSVIYDNDDLLAINKPYGLPVLGGPGVKQSVSKVLSLLRLKLSPRAERLYVLHRLDQGTTGVLLFARTAAKAEEIRSLTEAGQILKKYWCITKQVPHPREAVIDMPLIETKIGGRYKVIPAPVPNNESRLLIKSYAAAHARQALTDYKVLCPGKKCALVECAIHAGIRHQIRCHLAFGLECPIIGDHKYSHFMDDRFHYQSLPDEVLRGIGIRATKARDLPMCLHAREVHIPDVRTGRNIYISARLPEAFMKMMNKLRLLAV